MGSLIPVEYQQVEYLESTGTQYIITNIPIQAPIIFDSIQIFTNLSDQYLVGAGYGENGVSYRSSGNGQYSSKFQSAYNGYFLFGNVITKKIYHIVTLLSQENQTVTVDDEIIGTRNKSYGTEFDSTKAQYGIFCQYMTGSGAQYQSKVKLYSLKISNSTTLLGNFIPCYRKSDNEPGMYDTVSNTFFTNSGSGTFLMGGEVHEYGNLIENRKNIILNTPHLITTTAAPIQTFTTDLAAPLKECKIHFSPVQEGSGDPSPENVRPITGWTGVEVTRCGKNMWPNADGSGLLKCKWPKGTGPLVASGCVGKLEYYDSNNERIDYWSYGLGQSRPDGKQSTRSFTLLRDTESILITFNVSNTNSAQLEFGTTATAYEPYTGTTLPINWTTEAGTVYGGYVDLVTGEVWKKYHKITLDGVSSGCKVNHDYSNGTYIIGGVVYLSPVGASDYYSGHRSTLYCNNTPLIGRGDNSLNTLPFIRTVSTGKQYLRIYLAYAADHSDLDTEQKRIGFCNAYLTENPIDIVYPLQTPTLLTTLTPTQLKTLRGTNNIWSNANGNIELAYWSH